MPNVDIDLVGRVVHLERGVDGVVRNVVQQDEVVHAVLVRSISLHVLFRGQERRTWCSSIRTNSTVPFSSCYHGRPYCLLAFSPLSFPVE